jgi:hypothetical protein
MAKIIFSVAKGVRVSSLENRSDIQDASPDFLWSSVFLVLCLNSAVHPDVL